MIKWTKPKSECPSIMKKMTKESSKRLVCNYFEELGYLLRKNVIDIDFVSEMYKQEVYVYYDILKQYIDEELPNQDEGDKKPFSKEKIYDNFRFIHDVCIEYDKRIEGQVSI